MFNDIIVVQSAISAFNNAALFSPAFFWWAILALPLMIMVWWCAPMIMNKLHWTPDNFKERAGVVVSVFTFLWLILFGGNYAVLRDGMSVLPFIVAAIVFLTSLFVGSHMRDFSSHKTSIHMRVAVIAIILIALGLSDTHVWWGPLLQIGACAGGWFFGRIANGKMRPAAGMVLIMLMTTVAMLMQPEFFRFGQLGNLTPVHLMFILAMGLCGMATVAIYNINARGGIARGIFTKLKWLMRVLTILMIALFLLTESVPLFLALCAVSFIMFAMSVYHANKMSENTAAGTLAIMFIMFGAMTCMPVISAIGVLWWYILPRHNFVSEIKQLL